MIRATSRAILLSAFWAIALNCPSTAASLDGIAVDVTNASEPVLCAEKDNVTLNLASPEVRQFRVEAVHPVYIGSVKEDKFEPNWAACEDISSVTSDVPPLRRITFYEDVEVWLTGYSFGNFWRGKDVPVRVGDRVEHGLHLIQLWVRRNERAEEVLVLYPADGYWRIRPLPPAHLGWSAYGSSFLIGPVESEGRPVVNIKDIVFDRDTMTFHLNFDRGGSATLKLATLDRDRIVLDVVLDRPIAGRAFATLRSMYVTEANADVSRVSLREEGAKAWREEPVMTFNKAKATDLWAGRLIPSRHNMSAPDMVFNAFRKEPKP